MTAGGRGVSWGKRGQEKKKKKSCQLDSAKHSHPRGRGKTARKLLV